jgi:hypothetical protein
LSVRSVYNKEYDAMGVPAGLALVTIWGNTDSEPSEVLVQVAALADQTTSRSSDTA